MSSVCFPVALLSPFCAAREVRWAKKMPLSGNAPRGCESVLNGTRQAKSKRVTVYPYPSTRFSWLSSPFLFSYFRIAPRMTPPLLRCIMPDLPLLDLLGNPIPEATLSDKTLARVSKPPVSGRLVTPAMPISQSFADKPLDSLFKDLSIKDPCLRPYVVKKESPTLTWLIH